MQTVWTRAAQLGSACRCPHCASSVHSISRRATASASRRVPRYLTTSTFLYSGIFAAAATIDAKSKQERRDQWNHAIEEIKEELGPQQITSGRAAEEQEQQALMDEILPAFDEDSPLNQFGSVLDSSVLRLARHWAPESTAGRLDAKYLAPQSLYAPRYRKHQFLGRCWPEAKLERVRLCMDKLQLDMMHVLRDASLRQEAAQHVPAEYAKHITMYSAERRRIGGQKLTDLARLRAHMREHKDPQLKDWQRSTEDVPLSAYQMGGGSHFTEKTRHLNQTLQILFRRRARGKISRAELIAKVAHKLSSCPAPPNVDTFNTLIVGFAHLQEKRLYDRVTQALIHTRVRPNEATLAAIFKYDTDTADFTHFRLWLGLLRGQGVGLSAARPDIAIKTENKARLVARQDSTSGAIIQLPHPTPLVFDALIGGIIKFFGFETALGVCRDMGSEGWGLSMTGLGILLKDCVNRADWASGSMIWTKMQALRANSRKCVVWGWNPKVLRFKWKEEAISMPTYVAMLTLCKACKKTEFFEAVAAEAAQAHEIPVARLTQMLQRDRRSASGPDRQQLEQHEQEQQDLAYQKIPTTELPHTAEDSRGSAISQYEASTERRYPKRSILNIVPKTSIDHTTILQDQLHGLIPGDGQLEEYELCERPISIGR